MTYIKIYRSINSGCKHCFSSYARIHFRLWFIRDFRDFSCSIIALGRGGKKIQERNFISTVYSNENASGSRYRYESIFSSTSARISRIPINVLRSFLSFFFAQQRNGGLETSNDIMCRLIFAFRSRKLGERSWRKIVLLPDGRSISTIQRSKRRRKTRPSTNHVHERVGRRGIRGIQSRETRCVRNKRKKLPPPFSSFSTAVATIRQKEFLISGERKQQGRRGEGFQPGYARTTSNKILPRLNAPLNFAFRLPFRSTPTESSHYRQHPAFSSLFPLLFSSKEASLVQSSLRK